MPLLVMFLRGRKKVAQRAEALSGAEWNFAGWFAAFA
jgi:hypothetical protein